MSELKNISVIVLKKKQVTYNKSCKSQYSSYSKNQNSILCHKKIKVDNSRKTPLELYNKSNDQIKSCCKDINL